MSEPKYGTYEEAKANGIGVELTQIGRYRRVPVFSHNREQSAQELGNPKVSLNRRQRKLIHAARAFRLVPTTVTDYLATPQPVKFARKLTALKLSRLVRRQKKFARLASAAKHLLDRMMPGPSRIRSAIESRHVEVLGFFNQVSAEIKARALACEGRLAETTV